jgi:hypothetical protein
VLLPAAILCWALLAGAAPVHAGECTAAPGDETGNIVALAQELAMPTWAGGSAGFLEPFATVYQSALALQGPGCSPGCPFSADYGDVTCGDLVADPLDHEGSIEVTGIPDPHAYTALLAELLPDARWSLGAQGFILPAAGASQEFTRTFADFEGGFRDVLDVSSAQATPQSLAIDVFVARGDIADPSGCIADVLVTRAPQTVGFRVREDPVGPAPAVLLVDASTTFGTLELGHNPFQIEVGPNAVLYVDVYHAAQVQATGYNVGTSEDCNGGLATLDLRLDPAGTFDDGIQVFLSPAPALAISSRGGLAYAPVPEPAGGAAALAALAGLRARRRARFAEPLTEPSALAQAKAAAGRPARSRASSRR